MLKSCFSATMTYTLTQSYILKKPHKNEGRGGRKTGRKLILPQAAIFSARIRPSCGSASAGIRPLVRESPSIKIHDGWSGAEGSRRPRSLGEKEDERKKKLIERERMRDSCTAGRVTEVSREHAHTYFTSCTRKPRPR